MENNMELEIYKKSDFYEDYISSQKEYYERENADAYFAERLAEKDKEIALLKERICNGDVSRATWIDDCFDKDKEITRLKADYNAEVEKVCVEKTNVDTLEQAWKERVKEVEILNTEIAELKQKLDGVNELVKESKELLKESQKMHKRCADGAIKKIRHHKYKRCLAMARWCDAEVYNIRRTPLCDMDEHEGWQHDDEFWQRWHRRWLELAEQFKEGV